jgi:hypothetical protein
MKKFFFVGLLSGLLSAQSFNLYSYFNSNVGSIEIDTTKNSENLEIKLEIPVIPDGIYKASFFDFSIKKEFGFHKVNDSTYVETLPDEEFAYSYSDSAWNLYSYKGGREEKKFLVGNSYKCNSLVDIISNELKGNHKKELEIFIAGLKYFIKLPEFTREGNLKRLDFDVRGFHRWEDNSWVSYEKDDDVPFGNVNVFFDGFDAVRANGEVKILFFPINFYIEKQE